MQKSLVRICKNVLIPFLAVVFIITTASQLLHQADRNVDDFGITVTTTNTSETLGTQMDQWNLAMASMRAFWLSSEEVTAPEFMTFADSFKDLLPGMEALEWVDDGNIVRYVYPLTEENKKLINFDNNPYPNRVSVIEKARTTQKVQAAGPFMLVQGYPGIILYSPIIRDNQFLGTVVGVINLNKFLAKTEQAVARRLIYTAFIETNNTIEPLDGRTIFNRNGQAIIDVQGQSAPQELFVPPQGPTRSVALTFGDQTWLYHVIQIRPNQRTFWRYSFNTFGVCFAVITLLFLVLLERDARKTLALEARERDFVSLVSHQLRGPMTQLSWIVDLLQKTGLKPTQRKQFLIDMKTIISQGTKLITDLLNVSRIQRGVLKIEANPETLGAIIHDVLLPLHGAAKDKKIKLAVDLAEEQHVMVDKIKIVEALRNIVDNAIKYSPAGRIIEINAETNHDAQVIIAIRDHGNGIKAEVQKNLFEKATLFAPKSSTDGAGLGLYLTKEFIELMHGSIRFETSDQGTVFFVTLPAA